MDEGRGRKGEGSNNTCFDHGEEGSKQAAASQSPSMLTRIYMERRFGSYIKFDEYIGAPNGVQNILKKDSGRAR